MYDGYLNILKPPSMTSHDVVARVRRLLTTRQVGHAGTLDPAAVGVLPLALGRATRTLASPAWDVKEYWADVEFGTATTTDDAEGQVVMTGDPTGVDPVHLRATLASFIGVVHQRPPSFSAVHVDGERSYRRARQGDRTMPPSRPIHIEALTLLAWRPPVAILRVQCHSGTYIRSLARDLGEAVGCPSHLAGLVRTRMGPFTMADALTLEDLAVLVAQGAVARVLWPRDVACAHLQAVVVPNQAGEYLMAGRGWPGRADVEPGIAETWLPGGPDRGDTTRRATPHSLAPGHETTRVYVNDGGFAGLAKRDGESWFPARGLPQAATGDAE